MYLSCKCEILFQNTLQVHFCFFIPSFKLRRCLRQTTLGEGQQYLVLTTNAHLSHHQLLPIEAEHSTRWVFRV